jgi:hypothetical protein
LHFVSPLGDGQGNLGRSEDRLSVGKRGEKTMIELSVILFAFVVGALILICAPHDDDDDEV